MKKIISVLLIVCLVFSFAACGGKENGGDSVNAGSSGTMREKYDQMEYTIYENVMNPDTGTGAQLEGQKFTKDGVFGIIYDAYKGNIERYYVWGYADNTKCCCYQWEFEMPEGADIPPSGSYVQITGKLTYDADKALDNYWFTDVDFKVEKRYEGSTTDFDFTTLSSTLAMVEVSNMLYYAVDYFAGKTIRLFGRQYSAGVIQHPYWEQSWFLDYSYDGSVPADGEYITLTGVVEKSGDSVKIAANSLSVGG